RGRGVRRRQPERRRWLQRLLHAAQLRRRRGAGPGGVRRRQRRQRRLLPEHLPVGALRRRLSGAGGRGVRGLEPWRERLRRPRLRRRGLSLLVLVPLRHQRLHQRLRRVPEIRSVAGAVGGGPSASSPLLGDELASPRRKPAWNALAAEPPASPPPT